MPESYNFTVNYLSEGDIQVMWEIREPGMRRYVNIQSDWWPVRNYMAAIDPAPDGAWLTTYQVPAYKRSGP